MWLKELIGLLSDKKTSLDFIIHIIDNRIIFYKRGELFLKKQRFHLCKCDKKIASFIANKLIEKCESRENGIVECLEKVEEKLEEMT